MMPPRRARPPANRPSRTGGAPRAESTPPIPGTVHTVLLISVARVTVHCSLIVFASPRVSMRNRSRSVTMLLTRCVTSSRESVWSSKVTMSPTCNRSARAQLVTTTSPTWSVGRIEPLEMTSGRKPRSTSESVLAANTETVPTRSIWRRNPNVCTTGDVARM